LSPPLLTRHCQLEEALSDQGLPNADIAARLYLSPRTVTTHLTAIYTKLGVENRAAATAFAIDHGLR